MQENLLTMEELKQYFQVKDTRTIKKFIKQGLKYIPIGTREKRFDPKDVLEFVEMQKQVGQFELDIKSIRRKAKSKTINVDFQKRKINLELNKVI